MLNATQWKTSKCVSTLKQSASFCCMKANKRGGRSRCSLKSQSQHKHGFFFSVGRSCWQHSVDGPKIDNGLEAFKLCAAKTTPCSNQPYRPYPESQLVVQFNKLTPQVREAYQSLLRDVTQSLRIKCVRFRRRSPRVCTHPVSVNRFW